MNSHLVFPALALALLILFKPNLCAGPGDLDATFGTGGKVITAIGISDDYLHSVAIQRDGKILVAGSSLIGSDYDFVVARFNVSGSLDPSFNGTGKVTTPVGSSFDYGKSMALQSDGKIVVAGYCVVGNHSEFAIVRYNPDGSLDSTFDGTGKVTTRIGSDDYGYSVAVQSDGKIVVAGYSSGIREEFAVVRYNTNGSLDSSFNGSGKVTTTIGNSYNVGFSVALQSDGKIVVAGRSDNGSNYDFALVRFNANGSLDTTLNGIGKVITPIGNRNDYGYSVVIQSDGGIVVAGWSENAGGTDFALARYVADGSLDTSFNGTGKVTTPVGSGHDYGYNAAVQSDGKIVVAGWSNGDFALVRYNPNGSLDTTFNGNGKVTTTIGNAFDAGYSVAVQNDGKIVVAGRSHNGSDYDFALVRYQGGSPGDADSDGMRDDWELTYWPTTTAHGANDDPEGDGLTNLQELAFGLNPTLPDSALAPAPVTEGGYLTVTLTKHPGAAYEVQSAGTLLSGQPDSFTAATTTVVLDDSTMLKARDNYLYGTTPARFLRVKVIAVP